MWENACVPEALLLLEPCGGIARIWEESWVRAFRFPCCPVAIRYGKIAVKKELASRRILLRSSGSLGRYLRMFPGTPTRLNGEGHWKQAVGNGKEEVRHRPRKEAA